MPTPPSASAPSAMLDPAHFGAAIYAAHYAAWACDWAQAGGDARAPDAGAGAAGRRHRDAGVQPVLPAVAERRRRAAPARRRGGGAPHRAARCAAQSAARRCADARAGGTRRRSTPAALRIGFVSADFRTHATSMLLVQTLERLDRATLRGRALFARRRRRQRAAPAAGRRRRPLRRLHARCRPTEQAARIRADGIAILVDLSGYTASSRLGVFALRPAPVQVLWLAYPSTIGADFIDYVDRRPGADAARRTPTTSARRSRSCRSATSRPTSCASTPRRSTRADCGPAGRRLRLRLLQPELQDHRAGVRALVPHPRARAGQRAVAAGAAGGASRPRCARRPSRAASTRAR